MNTPKKVTSEEVDKEFEEAQEETDTKHQVDPTKIDSEYVGDLDGDADNTLPEEEELEIDREEKHEHATGEPSV